MSQSTNAGELFAVVHGSCHVGLSPATTLSLSLPSNLSHPDSIQRSRFTHTPSLVVLQKDLDNYFDLNPQSNVQIKNMPFSLISVVSFGLDLKYVFIYLQFCH